jgi:hypothetical protein
LTPHPTPSPCRAVKPRNPLAALELHIPAATLPSPLLMLDSAHRERGLDEDEAHDQVGDRVVVVLLLLMVGDRGTRSSRSCLAVT